MALPTWGTPAFVNTDDGPSTDPVYDPPYNSYYADRGTWLLPFGVFNVNEKIVALWWNTTFDEGYTAMTHRLQARYLTPADPVELGPVAEIFTDSVPLHGQTNPFAGGEYQLRGSLGMWDQNTWGSAIIGDQLYLQWGQYSMIYTEGGTWTDPPSFRNGKGFWIRVDCSGATEPAWAATWNENATFVSDFVLSRAVTYNLAVIDGRLVSIPQYAGALTWVMEHDLDTLEPLWQENAYDVLPDGREEVPFVAHSDNTQSFLMTYDQTWYPFTLGSSSLTFGTGEELTDTSLPGTIDQEVIVAYAAMTPTAAMRGPGTHANGMMISNYGYVTWHIWYESGAFGFETWRMFDYDDSPAVGSGYGYGYDNGPSFGYAVKVSSNELLIMPLFTYSGETSNDIYINVGIDADPEESLATLVHDPWTTFNTWASHVCAAQLSNGSGVLLQDSMWDDNDPPYGKMMAIPFFLSELPNLAGEFEAKDRAFWRYRP